MTKQAFIEMIENLPDNAEIVVSNYTIAFVVTDVEYDELWNQIILSGEQEIGGVEMKKYKVQLIQICTFEREVEAENRAQAEVKAKKIYDNLKNGTTSYFPFAFSHQNETFKIVPVETGSDKQ